MRKTERIIASVLGILMLGLVAVTIRMLTCEPWALGESFAESSQRLGGVFFGTGFFSGFLIAVGLLCLAFNLIRPSTYIFLMILSLVWMLVLEPILKLGSGTPYGPLEWIADALIGTVLLLPVIIHVTRNKMFNK